MSAFTSGEERERRIVSMRKIKDTGIFIKRLFHFFWRFDAAANGGVLKGAVVERSATLIV